MYIGLKKFLFAFLSLLVFAITINSVDAATAKKVNGKNEKKDETKRTTKGVLDVQMNSVSNIQFYTTNYGIFANPIERQAGGGFWPRGSVNQYIFGGGIWIGGVKYIVDSTSTASDCVDGKCPKKLVELSYNPNSGSSWMVPGRISDGDIKQQDEDNITKYRTYFSTDFISVDGTPINKSEGPNWPIWDSSTNPYDTIKVDRYFGYYINEVEDRTSDVYPDGPVFISGEDIFCTFKDTDLYEYEDGYAKSKNMGYPFRIQFEHTIYSWGFGDYKDFIFLRYDMISFAKDTIYDMWLAPVMDVDIAVSSNSSLGAQNDRTRFYKEDPSLNLAVQWSGVEYGEKDKGFGYLGFDFLESPSVKKCEIEFDSAINVIRKGVETTENMTFCRQRSSIFEVKVGGDTVWNYITFSAQENFKYCYETNALDECISHRYHEGGTVDFIRRDKRYFTNDEQIGLQTVRNWNIEEDLKEANERYAFIASELKDDDNGAGDKRFMMATGPFTMVPGDTVRTVVGIILANSVKREPTGEEDDLANLIEKDKFAQKVYDENFRAPKAPERSNVNFWIPYNNAILINWDSTAETSVDSYEKGLAFMGFRIYRARRDNLDTFDVNIVNKSNQYPKGKGPFGWKQVAQYELPTPFDKSVHYSGNANETGYPYIDSFRIIGPYKYKNDKGDTLVDSTLIKVMRMGKGIRLNTDSILAAKKAVAYYIEKMDLLTEIPYNNPVSMNPVFNPIISFIDTSYFTKPWGHYYLKKYQEHIKNHPKDTLPIIVNSEMGLRDYKFPMLDDIMIGYVKLNTALLKWNPLFYQRAITEFYQLPAGDERDQMKRNDTIFFDTVGRWADINSKKVRIMDILVKRDEKNVMNDTMHLQGVLDSIYTYIKQGKASTSFPNFEQDLITRRDIIMPYMKEITNNRTYFDIGDDDGDANIYYDSDPTKTEKMINNVDYYYRIISYDEGDYNQPTPIKYSDFFLPEKRIANEYTNVIQASARANTVADNIEFNVISVDSAKIGGLSNFKFFTFNQDRAAQLFADDTLVLEFSPQWYLIDDYTLPNTKEKSKFGWYRRRMTLTSQKTGKVLYDGITYLESNLCNTPYRGTFTDNALSYVLSDKDILDTVSSKTISFGKNDNKEKRYRAGHFTTGNFSISNYCYSFPMYPPAYGTLGFSFDYVIEQCGGVYRPDTIYVVNSSTTPDNITTALLPNYNADLLKEDYENKTFQSELLNTRMISSNMLNRTIRNNYDNKDKLGYASFANAENYVYGSYNNGRGDYKITFRQPDETKGEGNGTEEISVKWGKNSEYNNTFRVKYLVMDVENVANFEHEVDGKNVFVDYKEPMEFMKFEPLTSLVGLSHYTINLYGYFKLGSDGNFYKKEGSTYFMIPNPEWLGNNFNDFIGKYNTYSCAFANSRNLPKAKSKGLDVRPNKSLYTFDTKSSIGQQGRYYLSAYSIDGKDTLDFVNVFQVAGCSFKFDHVGYGTRFYNDPVTNTTKRPTKFGPEYDFKAGDVVMAKTTGGAFGYPLPGAKVKAAVSQPNKSTYTDDLLDKIKIVPNPYYITHEGQKSPYDGRIYFTKLPHRCTIEIYTITGEKIRTIEHDETFGDPYKASVEVWDLLSYNKQRVQSQTLVAIVKTPDGAQTVQNFSVVVGGFRYISE